MSPAAGRRGRPPRVTREQIAEAVLEVGFPGLTFAAVRQRLGVGETTLFRHAPDREELIRIGLERVLESMEWPSLDGTWRQMLRSTALAAWNVFEAHPGSATEVSSGTVPATAMEYMGTVSAVLLRHGFTATNAVLACDLVFDLVADNRRGVEHIDAIVPSSNKGRESLRELVRPTASVRPAEAPPEPAEEEREAIAEAIRGSISAEPLDWFLGKLEVVLDGIERSLAPPTPTETG